MSNGNQLTREEQAMLVEYKMCQQDVNSTSLNYWTLSGIFIGFSAVLLGAILYVLSAYISTDACALRTVILVVCVGMILILIFLWLWLKRVHYLSDRNYERKREIELHLGMRKSLKIHMLDKWHKMRRELGFKKLDSQSDEKINDLWQKTLADKELAKGFSEESVVLLADKQIELFEICYHSEPQRWYERPTRTLHYNAILSILIGLWLFLALNVLLPAWIAIVIIILIYPLYRLIALIIARCRSCHNTREKE